MSQRPNKQERRRMLREVASRQQQKELAALPADIAELERLIHEVDVEVRRGGCDHTLRHAERVAEHKGLNWISTKIWLHDHGGHCDCEVVMNCPQEIRRIRQGGFV